MFRKIFTFVFISQLCYLNIVFSQSDKIKEYLKLVNSGNITEVKLLLPDLLAEYPNDPGVQFLHACVLEDASKAVEIYEKIIRNYPQNEYADECYWRIIQYYVIIGEIEKAARELENYKKAFPNSSFLTPASDLVRTATKIARASRGSKTQTKPEVSNSEKAKPETTKPTPEPPKKGTFGWQVGIYSSEEAAKAEVERFRQLRLRADIFTKKVDNVIMYAVVIGDYPTKDKAEAEKPQVQAKCGCIPIIFQK